MTYPSKLKTARFIMFLAAVYNIFWGAVISLSPQIILFDSAPTVFMLIILKCVGMLVGVYGLAYYFASIDPKKYWALIFVGFAGKLLGPVGAFWYVYTGQLQAGFLWVNVFNDLIWLYPFGWVLYQALTGGLTRPKTDNGKTLYQNFLGDEFDRMSPNLRQFHQARTGIRALGEFRVTRGTGAINNILANIADLPQSMETAVAELIVQPSPSQEIWSRRLGDKMVISRQWLDNGFLVERFKVVNIYLTACVVNGDLIIEDAAVTIFGIPMPPFLTPAVFASGHDEGDAIAINVEIGFRPFGRIVNYCGLVKIQPLP